jgi:hypothetical protein
VHAHWRDLGEILVAEGKTIFMGSGTEPASNRRDNLAAQQAELRHITVACDAWGDGSCA